MNWNEITVRQYQQILPHALSDNGLDGLVNIISILEQLPIDYIDSQPFEWLLQKKKDYNFLNDLNFDKTAKSFIDVNGKRYLFVHEIEKMPAARYIETKMFSTDINANLHKIMASCVMPMRKNWRGRWVVDKYDATKHEQYANDMLDAKFIEVYNCVVFFYHVLRAWIEDSLPYLETMMNEVMNQQHSRKLISDLLKTMDGYIPPNKLPNMSV